MEFYVDGSSKGNPGPGGFGVAGFDKDKKLVYHFNKGFDNVTNNQMELSAILYVMENFGKDAFPTVYSDSAYAIGCFTNWGESWRRKGWINSKGKIPENLELVQKYFELYDKGYRVNLIKVRGHDGIEGNEIADKLARGEWEE